MSRGNDLRELIGEIDRFEYVSGRILSAMDRLMNEDVPAIGRTTTTGVAAAGLLENLYTAIETVLLRIAQNFGNNLRSERWHSDLLYRMTISVPDVRPAVLSETVHGDLDELMRFRHFKRYYFHLDYDWERLEQLMRLAHRGVALLSRDFSVFRAFVESVIAELDAMSSE